MTSETALLTIFLMKSSSLTFCCGAWQGGKSLGSGSAGREGGSRERSVSSGTLESSLAEEELSRALTSALLVVEEWAMVVRGE